MQVEVEVVNLLVVLLVAVVLVAAAMALWGPLTE
jgi:hypothetical protein